LKSIDVRVCPWVPYLIGEMSEAELIERGPADQSLLYVAMKKEAEGNIDGAVAAWRKHLGRSHNLGKDYIHQRLKAMGLKL
jgi:hypothetical protein